MPDLGPHGPWDLCFRRAVQSSNGLPRLTSRQSSTPGPKRACRLPLTDALPQGVWGSCLEATGPGSEEVCSYG